MDLDLRLVNRHLLFELVFVSYVPVPVDCNLMNFSKNFQLQFFQPYFSLNMGGVFETHLAVQVVRVLVQYCTNPIQMSPLNDHSDFYYTYTDKYIVGVALIPALKTGSGASIFEHSPTVWKRTCLPRRWGTRSRCTPRKYRPPAFSSS